MKRKTLINLISVLSIILATTISLARPLAVVAQGGDLFVDSGQDLGNSISRDVALGDLDGDGDPDAFVVNMNNQPNEVWLNDGTGVFTDSEQRLGNALDSRCIALGDLDGDGDLDAFVANRYEANKVWLNDGTSVFADGGQGLGSSESWGVALGDVDSDGDLDAFIANYNQPNKVWLNDGGGAFSDSGQNLGSATSQGVALGDLDGDGDLDAFVANHTWDGSKVWLNDGTGLFNDSGQNLGSTVSYDVGLGDVDGDGDLDAFIANGVQPDRVWLNNGMGIFSDSGQALGNSESRAVELGDLDSDGDLDAFVVNWWGGQAGQPDKVWLNNGIGTFSDSGQDLGSSISEGVALGDLDNDGDLDAFVATQESNRVWLNASSDTSPVSLVAALDKHEIYPGDPVTVALGIQNATDLYAAQAECGVDPTILELQSAAFGDFFDSVNRIVAANEISPTLGTWFGAISQQNPAGPLSGDGLFATLTLQATNPGTTTVTCDPLLSDRDGFTQTVSFTPANITVLSYATINGTATYQGRLTHAGVTVTATGLVTRTDTTDSNGDFVLDLLRAGTYTVTADVASYLPNCTTTVVDPGDVVALGTTRLLGGDLNDDEIINIGDATLLTANFGETVPPGDARADINADDIVNVQDLAILAGNYEVVGCQSW